MKAKTKTNKTKTVRTVKSKEKSYPAIYLVALLAAVLLLEGFLLGVATPSAWQSGLQVLDISDGFTMMVDDTMWAIEPLFVQAQNVEKFYQLAATELIAIMDLEERDPLIVAKSVYSFYELASMEMEKMLDFSNEFAYFPQVAGASISR